ncbi:phage tail protein, partial [Mammaliicoccus sciuri]
MAEYKISTQIDADTGKFKRAMEAAKRQAESLKRTTETMKDAKIDADTAGFNAKLKAARRQMQEFNNKRFKSHLDVNSSAANAAIARFKAMLKSIPNRHRTRLDVDSNQAARAIHSLARMIDNFGNNMDKLANRIRTTGTVISNMLKGTLLSGFTMLVPAIASLVPALMAVLNAVGVLAGGAAGLAGAFSIAGAGAVGFGAMAMTALKMVEDGTLSVTKEVKAYQTAIDGLKSAWQGVVRQNQAEIFNTLANGVNAAKVALAGMTPFL